MTAKIKTAAALGALMLGASSVALADSPRVQTGSAIGPFNVEVWAGGAGVEKPVDPKAPTIQAGAPFTLYAWIDGAAPAKGVALLASFGRPEQPQARLFGFDDGRLFAAQGDRRVMASAPVSPGLHLVAFTYADGQLHIWQDGAEVGSGPISFPATPPPPVVTPWDYYPDSFFDIAPLTPGAVANQHFAGRIGGITVVDTALSAQDISAQTHDRPDWSLTQFEAGSKPWPLQARTWLGYDAPQDPSTLPRSRAPFAAPTTKPPYAGPALIAAADGAWEIKGGWKLVPAPALKGADGAAISSPGFDDGHWYAATVPGTVLTTLVDRGVYPDPAYDLNNMAIPETLNKQDYWYRTEVEAPAALAGRHAELTFEGINYAAEAWLNGHRLGDVKGAFIRGRFDVTGLIRPGQANVLAVRISPPPHPGIPQEQSIVAGPGENGGLQMEDGPTFVATEGWDWIPGVRDRNSGIWQPVVLSASGDVRIRDPQVVTTLPLPDRSHADVTVTVTLENLASTPVAGELKAGFDDVAVAKTVTLQPGLNTVALTPAEYHQLTVPHPRLWWPNGYGEAALHDLTLSFDEGGTVSDVKSLKFGIREITYELSAFDQDGRLQRVELDPSKSGGRTLIDGDHEHIHKTVNAYAVSIHPGALNTPGLTALPDDPLSPFLVIKVNGVRIAVRGGAWGMDDFMKRVSPERLEPYFKLNRDAHMNILRNWVGQDTEEALYDLADKYGILVWNDFWESTQDDNIETSQEDLFLKNAADVISRYRNHASVAIWIGRNEGVPQPYVNDGLARLASQLDGTRYYAGSSNRVNLQDSGPYSYREPEAYFTDLSHGYAVEVGTPSFSTLEAFKAAIAPADQWPISDAWAYHDWHFSGNGDTHSFMASLATKFGDPTSLEDFEKKAQMLQYDSYRAVFEGMNAHLWTVDSGRMLWMTQPAWPSNHWQIYNWDYDTAAPYYAVMKAAEPVHVQLNLPDFSTSVTNTTLAPLSGLTLHAKVVGLDSRVLAERRDTVSVGADAMVHGPSLDLGKLMAQAGGPVFVQLTLTGADGAVLSRNFYWEAAEPAQLKALAGLPVETVRLTLADGGAQDGERRLVATLTNTGAAAALQAKLTLQNPDGGRILPARYADNYVSLLPGEIRTIEIRYPVSAAKGAPQVALRGWNLTPALARLP